MYRGCTLPGYTSCTSRQHLPATGYTTVPAHGRGQTGPPAMGPSSRRVPVWPPAFGLRPDSVRLTDLVSGLGRRHPDTQPRVTLTKRALSTKSELKLVFSTTLQSVPDQLSSRTEAVRPGAEAEARPGQTSARTSPRSGLARTGLRPSDFDRS